MDLTNQQKLEIIQTKITQNNAQLYSLKLDMDCATTLQDDQWKNAIREQTKKLMQIIEILQKETDALGN